MSGVEAVIGLVLGAMPLAISACEHWRGMAEKYDRFANFRKQYKKMCEDLKDEQTIFRLLVSKLVRPLVNVDLIQETDLDRIMSDLSDPLWADEDVNQAIRARLGETYESFFRVVRDTNQQCMVLLRSLGLQRDDVQKQILAQQAMSDPSNPTAMQRLMNNARSVFATFDFAIEAERIAFAFNKMKYKEIIANIHSNTEKLDKFLDLTGQVAALHDSHPHVSRHPVAKHLLQYWRHAERVYHLLRSSFGCACQDQHYARLWLQHRPSPPFEFCLLMLFSSKPVSTCAWKEQSLRIEKLQTEVLSRAQPSPISIPPANTSCISSQCPTKKGLLGSMLSRLKSAPRAVPTIEVSIPTVRISTPPASAAAAPTLLSCNALKRLCHTLSSCGDQSKVLGALEDHDADQFYSVAVDHAVRAPLESISLMELLQSNSQPCLTRKDSYAVALAVTSTYLQLSSTAWTTGNWTAGDVLFPLVAQTPLLSRPFISARFKEPANAEPQLPQTNKDRTFAALGIMLLELCDRRLIEESIWWQKLGFVDENQKSQALYRLVVAGKWSEDVEAEEGFGMASAIKWCLNESPRSLDGEQWRRDLADRVVLPIQNCCQYLSKGI